MHIPRRTVNGADQTDQYNKSSNTSRVLQWCVSVSAWFSALFSSMFTNYSSPQFCCAFFFSIGHTHIHTNQVVMFVGAWNVLSECMLTTARAIALICNGNVMRHGEFKCDFVVRGCSFHLNCSEFRVGWFSKSNAMIKPRAVTMGRWAPSIDGNIG